MADVVVGDGVSSFGNFNGSTQAPIQAAVDSLPNGGVIYIRRGTYNFSAPLALPYKPFTFFGDGDEQTILKRATDIVMIPLVDNLTVEEIEFENAAATYPTGNGCLQYTDSRTTNALTVDLKDVSIRRCSFRQRDTNPAAALLVTRETIDYISNFAFCDNKIVYGLVTSGSVQNQAVGIHGRERDISTISRTVGGVVTVTTSANHGYLVGRQVNVVDAVVGTDRLTNGRWTIASTPALNQFTYNTGVLSAISGGAGANATAWSGGLVSRTEFRNNIKVGGGCMFVVWGVNYDVQITGNISLEAAGPAGGYGEISVRDAADGSIANNTINSAEHAGIHLGLGAGGGAGSMVVTGNVVHGVVGSGIYVVANGSASGQFPACTVVGNFILSATGDGIAVQNTKDSPGLLSEYMITNNHIRTCSAYNLALLNATAGGAANGGVKVLIVHNNGYAAGAAGIYPPGITFNTGLGNTSIVEKNIFNTTNAAW